MRVCVAITRVTGGQWSALLWVMMVTNIKWQPWLQVDL